MKKTRVTLFLDADAAEKLATMTGERKRSEFVSELIRRQHREVTAHPPTPEALRALAASMELATAKSFLTHLLSE